MKSPRRVSLFLCLYSKLGNEPFDWREIDAPSGDNRRCVRQLFQGDRSFEVYAIGSELPDAARLLAQLTPELVASVRALESLSSDAIDRLNYAQNVALRLQRRAYAHHLPAQYDDLGILRREVTRARDMLKRDCWFESEEEQREFEARPVPDLPASK